MSAAPVVAPDRPHPVEDLFGIPVAAIGMDDVLAEVERAVGSRRPLHLGVVNAAKIVNMRRDPSLRADVLASDLILADGTSVVWASRLLGRALPERVAGIDVMMRILERAAVRGYRVYCLGATPEVLAAAIARAEDAFPGLRVVGSHHGYFGASEERAVADAIAASRADILFVAMSSPRKEQFLARWSPGLRVAVCHGVGGSFDVMAGKVRRAPVLWQRLGLEWLYRVAQEPRRLWRRYLVTNTVFCGMVMAELAGRRRGTRVRDPRAA